MSLHTNEQIVTRSSTSLANPWHFANAVRMEIGNASAEEFLSEVVEAEVARLEGGMDVDGEGAEEWKELAMAQLFRAQLALASGEQTRAASLLVAIPKIASRIGVVATVASVIITVALIILEQGMQCCEK